MEEYYDGVVAKPDLDELYHHGILGQKWHVKHGPPYPLGSDVSTGSRLRKTKKRLARATKKASKANKMAAKATNSFLHPGLNKHVNAYQTQAFKAQAKVDKLQNKLAKEEKKEAKREEMRKALNYSEDPKMAAKLDAEMKKAVKTPGTEVYSEDPKMAAKLDAEMKKAAKTEGAEVYDFNAKDWVDAARKEIDNQVNKTRIKRDVTKYDDYEYVDKYGDFKVGDSKIRVRGDGDKSSDDEIKKVASDILKNKSNIVDSCIEAMKGKDSYVPHWIPDGMSEKDFYDGLDLKSASITKWKDNDVTVELSFWEKDESTDLIGGHSIDIEMPLNDLINRKRKIPGYQISING